MSRPRRTLHVTVVSSNAKTLKALSRYLSRAGAAVSGTRLLDQAVLVAPEWASAVVIFPDEFSAKAVSEALASLAEQRPTTLPVLVTAAPARFESLRSVRDGLAPLVLPRPAWAWTILDAIRAVVDGVHKGKAN